MTKRDLCIEITGAYCERSEAMSCSGSSACASANKTECESLFDGSCLASQAMADQVDHDIEMIIVPKESCSALESIDSYLQGTVTDIQQSACQ